MKPLEQTLYNYGKLLLSKQLKQPTDTAWATGWGAKTIGIGLEDDVFYRMKSQFRLGRKDEEEFPKSRRLIESGSAAEMPLG